MNLEETREKLEWRKCAFKYEQKSSYGIEKQNDMIHIHDKEVNNIAEWNLIQDIINPPKRAKILNIHYYPILHGWMNTRNGREKFKNSRILLDSGCGYTIVTGRLVEKIQPEKYALM